MAAQRFTRCTGSGGFQMIDWEPTEDYPGAVVCLGCSYGVLIVKGSDHDAVSQAGHEGRAGKVRVHYVTADKQAMRYRR